MSHLIKKNWINRKKRRTQYKIDTTTYKTGKNTKIKLGVNGHYIYIYIYIYTHKSPLIFKKIYQLN